MICRQVFARWDCIAIIESLLITHYMNTRQDDGVPWSKVWLHSCGKETWLGHRVTHENCNKLWQLSIASFACKFPLLRGLQDEIGHPFWSQFWSKHWFLVHKNVGGRSLQAQQHNNDNSNNNNNNNERKTRNKKMTNGFQFYMLHICMNSLIYYLKIT